MALWQDPRAQRLESGTLRERRSSVNGRDVVHAVEHDLAGGLVPVSALGEYVGVGVAVVASAFGYLLPPPKQRRDQPKQANGGEEERREDRRPHGEVELEVAEAAGHTLDTLQVQREPEQPVKERDCRCERKDVLGDPLAEGGADRGGDHRRRDPDGRPHQPLLKLPRRCSKYASPPARMAKTADVSANVR